MRVIIILYVQQRRPPVVAAELHVGCLEVPVGAVSHVVEHRGLQQDRRRQDREHPQQTIQVIHVEVAH